MTVNPILEQLIDSVREAAARGTPIRIHGGGSKQFYGEPVAGQPLDVTGYQGIVEYEPTELYITARTGTRLSELAATLAEHNQMLAFEPPCFTEATTVGGMVAAGLSGPRRAYVGAIRDFTLGVSMLDGRGQPLQFGGKIMKNVAGYDVSRLLVGSMGCLGILTEVTLKVMPRPRFEQTRVLEMTPLDALTNLNRWAGQPLPISASAWHQGRLWLRLSGAESAVMAASLQLGGEPSDDAIWSALCHQHHMFFTGNRPLWRLSLPATAPWLPDQADCLLEWGSALRWVVSDEGSALRSWAVQQGGHATLFRHGGETCPVFTPPSTALLALHRRLKQRFDPAGVLNPGRLYPGV
ncbi:glycolate oxidase subunit GlcE [Chitinivorax sp. B]|uniref:glycolate oxidase subunit GlcE n=1 Tax=Chitinivorax sp. B TaxID=2502235 RepID=UPI0010F9A7C2|nr:glycolate oxidase subunit GlcE [Chitinivorax sp. B]